MKLRTKLILIAAAVIHALLLYLTLTRQLDFLFNDAAHRVGPGSDFLAMYLAGKHWLLGDSVYGQGPGFGFRYFPIIAMTLYAWLSGLKAITAYYVWVGISEVFLLASVISLRKLIADDFHFALACLIGAGFSSLYLDLFMGNSSVAVAALLLSAYYLYIKRRHTGALIIFLIACLIKPIGLVFLPLALLKEGWKPALVVVLILVALNAAYFWQHTGDLIDLIALNFTDSQSTLGFLVHAGNQGFDTLLLRMATAAAGIRPSLLESLSQLPVWCSLLVYGWPALLALVSLWITWRHRHTPNIELLLFLYLAAYLLGYKDVWEHSYSIMLCALPFLYLSRTVSLRTLLIGAILLALPTAFAFYDIHYADSRMHDPDWNWSDAISILHHATKPAGLLFLYVAALIPAVKSSSKRTDPLYARLSDSHSVRPF